MYKSLLKSITIFLILGFIFSCGKKEKVLVPSDYKSWTVVANNLDYPIPGHENHGRKIYINDTGKRVGVEYKSGRATYNYPVGSIIVKEIYPKLKVRKGDKPISLTVMIKDPNNPLSRGGWLWVVKDMKTRKERIIDYEFCVDCHSNANETHPYGDKNPNGEFRDFVFYPYKGNSYKGN